MKKYANFTVLIVDDNQNNLFTLRTLIQKYTEVNVLEAQSGAEALEIAVKHAEIDLIILDIQMPEMDGFQTASMLKIRKKTKHIPVIFLTAAYKADEFQQQGYKMGAVDYLLKPIDDNLLLNKLTAYFRLIEKERSLNTLLEEKVVERTEELVHARNYLQKLIDTMGEALIVLTADGMITRVNPACTEMLSYDEASLLGMNIGDVFEEAYDEQASAFMGTWIEAVIRAGVIKDVEARFVRSDGSYVPVLLSRTAIQENGVVTDIICVAKNMSGYLRNE